jgi:hypothetical protein
MSSHEQDDVLWKAVSTLPTVAVSQARSEQVRLHCHRVLERGQPPETRAAEPLTVGTICAIYAWHILRLVIR